MLQIRPSPSCFWVPGTGKELDHFIVSLPDRNSSAAELVVIYDPGCEFIKRRPNRHRGDVILNPTDESSEATAPESLAALR